MPDPPNHGRAVMSDTTIGLIVFACIFGGALCGIFLHAVLPQHHLQDLGPGLAITHIETLEICSRDLSRRE